MSTDEPTQPVPAEDAKQPAVTQSPPGMVTLSHRCAQCGHEGVIRLVHFAVMGVDAQPEERRLVTPVDIMRMRAGGRLA